MSRFTFVTDAESDEYCEAIVREIVSQFGISEEEALGRLNVAWGPSKPILGHEERIYHEAPKDWAKFVYYRPGTHWWREDADLTPRSYP